MKSAHEIYLEALRVTFTYPQVEIYGDGNVSLTSTSQANGWKDVTNKNIYSVVMLVHEFGHVVTLHMSGDTGVDETAVAVMSDEPGPLMANPQIGICTLDDVNFIQEAALNEALKRAWRHD